MPIFSAVWSLKEQGVAVKGDRWQFPPVTALWAGGNNNSNAQIATIDFLTIATSGNASDFGDLLESQWSGGASSGD